MALNLFEKKRQCLHFNDSDAHLSRESDSHDRLHKLRLVVDHLNEIFSKIPHESYMSADEQLCFTKISHYIKYYLPTKRQIICYLWN